MNAPLRLWSPLVWLHDANGGNWAQDVLLQASPDGYWSHIQTHVQASDAIGAELLPGALLPGVVNAHSHAFQRCFAGLAERREGAHDDFWSWRNRMYQVALAIQPEALRAVAAMLYLELLQGGYTHVCEFHYLHHATDGSRYDEPLLMSWMLREAAEQVGIGLTLLPVLYERAGFEQTGLQADQRRFATDVDWVLQAQRELQRAGGLVHAGVAIHSLRAARPESITKLVNALDSAAPIHIHIAEQTNEVQDCLRVYGQRPLQWLAQAVPLDARWQLVHATHVEEFEMQAASRAGAAAVICPSTEANLGDGFTDVPAWLNSDVGFALGSDSHVTRNWPQELRLLEYGQRLLQRRRNLGASTEQPDTAARLFSRLFSPAGRAAGPGLWGIQLGARADAVLLHRNTPGLLGLPMPQWLNALVFSCEQSMFSDVWVAGKRCLCNHQHPSSERIHQNFVNQMQSIFNK